MNSTAPGEEQRAKLRDETHKALKHPEAVDALLEMLGQAGLRVKEQPQFMKLADTFIDSLRGKDGKK